MADISVFTRLKRLFSTDVVIRNEGGNQLRVMDVDSIQRSGRYETNWLLDTDSNRNQQFWRLRCYQLHHRGTLTIGRAGG